MQRAAVELAKDWRQDRILRKLEALLIVMDKTGMLLISGGGEIIEPDDDIIAIGSGGNFALSAARALKRHAVQMEARKSPVKGHDAASAPVYVMEILCSCVNRHQHTCRREAYEYSSLNTKTDCCGTG